MAPKISVVIPSFNRAHLIQNAINSIIYQSFKDWELIIVSDGSTDNTEQVVKAFGNDNIKYFNIPHTGNICKVRNYGKQQAKGELIVVQDSDDISLPERLQMIWDYHEEHPDVDLIYHDIYLNFYDPKHDATCRVIKNVGEFDKKRIIKEQYIPGHVAYKRSAILKTPYNEKVVIADDMIMLIEMALSGYKFGYIKRPLYDYIMVEDSINVIAELDGRRFTDAQIVVDILKDKYNIKAMGELKRWSLTTGELLKHERTR